MKYPYYLNDLQLALATLMSGPSDDIELFKLSLGVTNLNWVYNGNDSDVGNVTFTYRDDVKQYDARLSINYVPAAGTESLLLTMDVWGKSRDHFYLATPPGRGDRVYTSDFDRFSSVVKKCTGLDPYLFHTMRF